MKGVDRRKPSKWVATPSNGATAAHTVKRRETLRILTSMSIRPSCGGRRRGLRKPSGGGACSHPHTGRCISAPPRGRFRIACPLFTLLCRRCGPTVRSRPQGGKRVGADIEAPAAWAAHPAGNRTGPVLRRPDVTHPRLKRDFGRLLSSDRRFSPVRTPPPQALFCHWRPNSGLSTDCSPVTSHRGRSTPDSATKSRLRPLRHQTLFPVHPRHCKKRLPDWRPSVAPPCVRSFSASRSFTLSGEGCGPVTRSKPQEVNILALSSTGRATTPVTPRPPRPQPGGRGGSLRLTSTGYIGVVASRGLHRCSPFQGITLAIPVAHTDVKTGR